jgi:heat shock protein HslJ
MKRGIFLLSVLAITGCVTAPPPGPVPAYHALGTEPFWSLTVDQRELVFTRPDAQPVRQPRPKAIIGFAGEIYRTPRLNVNIVHAKCSDGMSDRTYPDKVQVDVDGRSFEGCGGL